eukprot:1158079-Pelagomonas_calceolata.AAC.9
MKHCSITASDIASVIISLPAQEAAMSSQHEAGMLRAALWEEQQRTQQLQTSGAKDAASNGVGMLNAVTRQEQLRMQQLLAAGAKVCVCCVNAPSLMHIWDVARNEAGMLTAALFGERQSDSGDTSAAGGWCRGAWGPCALLKLNAYTTILVSGRAAADTQDAGAEVHRAHELC